MANVVADTLRQAASLNGAQEGRQGNVVHLDRHCEVIVAGDLHGNRGGLSRIIDYAPLDRNWPGRLILQEIIHGPPDGRTGQDRSIEVLLRAARLKIEHPREVLFLLGNHDLAQATGNEVTRNGQPSCRSFSAGVAFAYGEAADEILAALKEFALSMPLAIRCANGVLICHSLPSPARMDEECFEVLDRPYRMEDLRRGGPVYEWTWGRRHTAEQLDQLAERLGLEFFILGHLHCPNGYEWLSPRAITLSSDDEHGCVMRFSTGTPLTADSAQAAVKPMVTLG